MLSIKGERVKLNIFARGAALALAASILPTIASAQVIPNLPNIQWPWSNNGGNYGPSSSEISGTVSSFGGYNMTLNGGQSVSLHQGTVINPTGTSIQPGMNVVVIGYQSGNTFNANEVDVNGSGNGGYYNNGYPNGYNGYPNGYNNGQYPNGYYNNGYPNGGYYNGDPRQRDRWERQRERDRMARERAAQEHRDWQRDHNVQARRDDHRFDNRNDHRFDNRRDDHRTDNRDHH